MRVKLRLRLIFPLVLLVVGQIPAQGRLILSGGRIIDGSGSPPFTASVAVVADRIVAIGEIEAQPGDQILDVSGRIVAPGFIDLHNHSTNGILGEPSAVSQVSQGITTLMLGADGSSPFPIADFLLQLERQGSAPNAGVFAGQGTLRSLVLGDDYKRTATPAETEAMGALLETALKQGAFGLSSGLEYDPGYYSTTEELIALARISARYRGLYMSHIRDEEEGFSEALREAVRIGRETGSRVQISHLKLGNTRVWGRTGEALQILTDGRRDGIDIMADSYPYNAWASSLSILVPSRRFDDEAEVADGLAKVGGPDKVLITRYPHQPDLEFKTLLEIAQQRQISPTALYQEIIRNGNAGVVCESMNSADVDAFLASPIVMVASDGGIDSRHPRKAGTFPRVLGRFVRERKVLSLTQAVRKMTSLPASRIGLRDRGRIEVGYYADLTVFSPENVLDRATFQDPDQLATGIELTIVNGTIVWDGQNATGRLPGTVLRR